MLTIKRTNSNDTDFLFLVDKLNTELLARYGELQVFYNQFNHIENLETAVVAYENNNPAGCACFKNYKEKSVEIKRMYVADKFRSKGIGAAILLELENWARELKNETIVLETGYSQPEAVHLYKKVGYTQIPNYGQYAGMEETSICFEKKITKQ